MATDAKNLTIVTQQEALIATLKGQRNQIMDGWAQTQSELAVAKDVIAVLQKDLASSRDAIKALTPIPDTELPPT